MPSYSLIIPVPIFPCIWVVIDWVAFQVLSKVESPEEVTPYNIKKLSLLVKKGRETYPGANYVHRVNYIDGKLQPQRIDLKYRKKDIKYIIINFSFFLDIISKAP